MKRGRLTFARDFADSLEARLDVEFTRAHRARVDQQARELDAELAEDLEVGKLLEQLAARTRIPLPTFRRAVARALTESKMREHEARAAAGAP